MPTTTNGLPYPSWSDGPAGPTQFQALAEAVDTKIADTGWVSVNLAAGVTGVIQVRKIGQQVEVRVNVSGTFPHPSTTPIQGAGGLPSVYRPSVLNGVSPSYRRGQVALSGAPDQLLVGSDGTISVRNATGGAKTAADGSVTYMLG